MLNIPLRPSPRAARRLLTDMDEALSAIHAGNEPPESCVAVPHGLERSLLKALPFRVRTSNCLAAGRLFQGTNELLVKDLLLLRNFGRTSLQDLLLVIKDYLTTCIRNPVRLRYARRTFDGPSILYWLANVTIDDYITKRAGDEPLGKLLVAASEFHGATSLADLLAPDAARLASIIGVYDKLRSVDITSLSAGQPPLSAIVLADAHRLCDNLKPHHQTVLERRIIASPPDTLVQVGETVGLSKERIRQIQEKITRKLDVGFGVELDTISRILKAQLGGVASKHDVDSRIDSLIAYDGTPGAALARHAVRSGLRYSKTMNGVCLDQSALAVVQALRSAAPGFVEDGIIDQEGLKTILPEPKWEQNWDLLLKGCGFYEVFGFIAQRDSDKARTKAALLSIGVPATREEIAELCGLSPARVGAYLSSFPSVVRADLSRWGLAEWIQDRYEGIEAEITQRIEEGGGVTTTSRLFKELPDRFGVSRSSVSAYLQGPKFVVHEGGHVTLADT